MKTATQNKILSYIKNKNGASAGDISDFLGLHPTGVFRHLKKLINNRLIYKVGHTPKVIYYPFIMNTEKNSQIEQNAVNWAISGNKNMAGEDVLCQTRDIFQARLDHLFKDLQRKLQNDNLTFLIIAIIGEIGNNSFDHNIGSWPDTPGINMTIDVEARKIILADRGRGVFATIKPIKPEIINDSDAIKVAFTEIISGRYPEQRGNGLKFVKGIIEKNNLWLNFYSGKAAATIDSSGLKITQSDTNIQGTLSIIKF